MSDLLGIPGDVLLFALCHIALCRCGARGTTPRMTCMPRALRGFAVLVAHKCLGNHLAPSVSRAHAGGAHSSFILLCWQAVNEMRAASSPSARARFVGQSRGHQEGPTATSTCCAGRQRAANSPRARARSVGQQGPHRRGPPHPEVEIALNAASWRELRQLCKCARSRRWSEGPLGHGAGCAEVWERAAASLGSKRRWPG